MRIRLRYSKFGKVRFLGHRDLARVWERAWRKAQLPIVYTEGFSPRPKMHFGLALSTGYESLGEYLDVDVPDDAGIDVDALPGRLTPLLPDGVDAQAAAELAPGTTSLQEAVGSCSWTIEVTGVERPTLEAGLTDLLAADVVEVARERKGKTTTDDIRPYLRSLEATGAGHRGLQIDAELATQPRALRPAELFLALAAIDAAVPTLVGVVRTHQWISPDGARQEPLPLPATWAPHAEARAS
jgi:radical SAM-linked protein